MSESIDPENEFAYKVELYQCHACAATSRAVKTLDDMAGLRSRVWR